MDFMKQKQMKRTLYCLLLSALGITTSCVDNSYDLTKDIDMTITIGGDLTTPGSSSDSIKLKDLLDIDTENSDLKEEPNGDYVLKINGDPTNSTIKVDKVVIDASTSDTNSSDELTFVKTSNYPELPIQNLNPNWELSNGKEPIPEEVVDLEYVEDITNNVITLNLNLSGTANGVILKKGLTFTFPSYLDVSADDAVTDALFEFKKSKDNTKSLMVLKKDHHLSRFSDEQWKIKLNKVYFSSSKENGVVVPESEGFIPAEKGNPAMVKFNVEIPITGNVTVEDKDFPANSSNINFKLVSTVTSQEMTLEKVRAKVDPVIDFNVSDVTIEDLPDFLTDNKVVADLDNPQVLLNVTNTAEVDVNFQAVLSSYKGGENKARIIVGTDTATNNESTIRLKGGSIVNKICLSPKKEDVPEGYTWVQVAGLPSLVRDIPDLIKVEDIDAKVLPNFYTVVLGVDKIVNTDYELNAPLEFGKYFQIVYNDTIDGWTEDIEDYEMKEVVVTLNAKNTIPLNLDIEAFALDVNGNEMPDVKIEVEGNIAAAEKDEQTGETKEKTSALTITLTKDDGSRIKNLDGLILRLTGCAVPEDKREEVTDFDAQILNANQTLKLEDLKLRIKGGVTMDLN